MAEAGRPRAHLGLLPRRPGPLGRLPAVRGAARLPPAHRRRLRQRPASRRIPPGDRSAARDGEIDLNRSP